MTLYLAYSYSVNLTEKQKIEIDQQVKKNKKEFGKGFRKGTQISFSIYSAYLLVRATSAYAADSSPNPVPASPGNNEGIQAASNPKPGFKPVSDGAKGAFVGGASAICGSALQSGDFYLGLACAFLLVIGGIIINRPD